MGNTCLRRMHWVLTALVPCRNREANGIAA